MDKAANRDADHQGTLLPPHTAAAASPAAAAATAAAATAAAATATAPSSFNSAYSELPPESPREGPEAKETDAADVAAAAAAAADAGDAAAATAVESAASETARAAADLAAYRQLHRERYAERLLKEAEEAESVKRQQEEQVCLSLSPSFRCCCCI